MIVSLGLSLCAAAALAGPQVMTASGAVEGMERVDAQVFYGIPYAAPPVGDLRWRAPQPVERWDDVRAAMLPANDCMQKRDGGEGSAVGTEPAEDCLYLNVWRPDPQPGVGPLPVLVWIHGGAYLNGGSSSPIYEASALARRGLIVVSLNYRLGRFGFFSHPALMAAGEGETGNFALLDMIAALDWVKANAAAFGGDPDDLTVMGQSAGGDAVMHLLTAPRTAGLIDKAVVISGDGRSHLLGGLPLTGANSAVSVGQAFAEAQGIFGDGPEALAALRALPVDAIVGKLNMTYKGQHPDVRDTYAMGPIVDGSVVLDAPGVRMMEGAADSVPLLIGTTNRDVAERFPPADDPFALFGPRRAEAEAAYAATGVTKAAVVRAAIGSDLTMQEPARFAARRMAMTGQPAWRYRFSYVPSVLAARVTGAGHASDLPFLFGTLETRFPGKVDGTDTDVSRIYGDYIANFARSGDPNGPGLPPWPMQDAANEMMMVFAPDGVARGMADPLGDRLDLIEAVTEDVP